jgi:hypothetical protein
MPKTAVQTPICDICGAEVREGSLFCYNCGGSLKKVAAEPAQTPEVPVAPPAPTNGASKPSAPSKREARKRKPIDRGPVEVVWAPREGISLIYVVAGVILLIIAVVLFIVAMLLK